MVTVFATCLVLSQPCVNECDTLFTTSYTPFTYGLHEGGACRLRYLPGLKLPINYLTNHLIHAWFP